MTTCPDCAGTGGGHPDDIGYRCHRCGGTGGIPDDYDGPALIEMSTRMIGADLDRAAEASRKLKLAQEWRKAGFGSDEAWRRAEMGVSPDGR